MVGAFEGIPPILVHGVTIDLTLVPVTGNLEQEARWWRRRVRRALGKVLTKGAIARGKLDIALKYADELSFELPDSDLPRELQGQDAPHTRYAMLHIHFGCFDPWLSRSELTKRLSKEFPGKKRVCVRASHDDFELADGTIVPGIKGYLEYMSLEKVELDFGEDSIEAVVEFADIDGTWKRANRDIRYGDRPDSICDLIDDSRVRYLEAERLRQKHKKNWKNMGFAEQFLHKWMTNAVDVYNQVMSGDGVSIAPNSQGSVPNLICNWTLGIVSQATYRARKYIKRSVKTFGKPLRDGCKPVITGSIRP